MRLRLADEGLGRDGVVALFHAFQPEVDGRGVVDGDAPEPETRYAALVVMVRLRVVEGQGVAAEIASRVSYYAVGVVGVILGAVVLDQKVGGLDAVVVPRPFRRRGPLMLTR